MADKGGTELPSRAKERYASPVRLIELTQEREITPFGFIATMISGQ